MSPNKFTTFNPRRQDASQMTTRFFKMCRQMSSNVSISRQMSLNVVIRVEDWAVMWFTMLSTRNRKSSTFLNMKQKNKINAIQNPYR
jgi:hypothetical protein